LITQTNNATDNTEAMDDFYLCVDVIIVKTRSSERQINHPMLQ
jgi:hypothetical protein